MEAPACALVGGAMSKMPAKLDGLLKGHGHMLPKEAKNVLIPLIKQNLESMIAIIEDDDNSRGVVRCLMKEVRELSYDIHDCIDELAAGPRSDHATRLLQRMTRHVRVANKNCKSVVHRRKRKATWLSEKLKGQLWLLDKIKEFSSRSEEALRRYNSFNLGGPLKKQKNLGGTSTASTRSAESFGSWSPPPYGERADHLVGIDVPMNTLEAWLKDEDQKLKVVSMVGSGGIGKTTLANELYRRIGGDFECVAFVRTSQKPDVRRLLTSMLSQVRPHQHPHNWKVHNLIADIRSHLHDKRYLIVIDDVWATSTWDVVNCALPDDNCCSRILITSDVEDVALTCCGYDPKYVYKMKPLGEDDSRKLFFNTVVGPPELSDVSNSIIRKCGGLPLAIVTTASLLASRRAKPEHWEYVDKSLGHDLMTNPTLEGMKQVLNLSYSNLPQYLKACMLYLSIYLGDYIIWRDDLVNQWIAEDFICATQEKDEEEISRSYFDELIGSRLIQPIHIDGNGEVLSCTVHDIVRNLIVHQSIVENFVATVDHCQTATRFTHKVRRLCLYFGNAEDATLPTNTRLSQVRTLAIFGVFKFLPSFTEFRLLQVLILHLWGDQESIIFDFDRISELFRLRYLQVTCNVTLEALQIQLRGLPYLPHLLHLNLPAKTNLRNGIGHMTSLRTLGYFDLSCNSIENVQSLGELANLQDLRLTCSTLEPGNLKNNMQCLGSILWKLRNLKSITLGPGSSSHVNTLGDASTSSMSISCDGLRSVSPAPVLLQRLELWPRMCIFSCLPKWFGDLDKLCILKIAVREISREDVDILKGLPALTGLSLDVWTAPEGSINIDNRGFRVLKYFKFMCTAPCLLFEKGAMPNVRKLKLGSNANRTMQHSLMVAGLMHLTGLREISLKLGVAGADKSDIKAAESALLAAVNLHPNTLISRVQLVDRIFYVGEDESAATEEQEHSTLEKQHAIQGHKKRKTEHSDEDLNKEIDRGISRKSKLSLHLQNPVAEQKTVAVAMEDGMVSASTGAMDSVLRKLTVLLADDNPKLRGKQEEVKFLKKELDAMHAILEHLADMPAPNMEMKRMRNQMKEMTYEVEDWIDGLMLKFDEHLLKRTSGYPEKWDMLEEFIDQIRNLTVEAEKADLPVIVERTEIQTPQSSYKATESGLHTLYNKAVGLVSIDGPRDELVKRMNGGEHHLQVVCILGSSGIGKTTLTTEVCNQLRGPFDHRIFIQVPRKMDITRLHKVILRQLHRQLQARYYQDNMDEASQIDEVRRYLRDKRYLIVIDGVWSAQTWEVLRSALPEDKRGSRILVTTDDSDVAELCKKHSSDFTYCLLPLPPRESLRLFRGILFGSDRSCPMELEKVAEKILVACGGIPMAIIIMAGILACKPAEAAEWEMMEKRMEPVAGDGDLSKEMIRKMFHISYSGLPRDIKSCLLYLSIFPENQFIRKDRLIWRWIAEGFVPKRSGESSWETGERYFLELIARNLIEPVYEEEKDDYEVPVGCKVHGLILEFITSLSNEENLVTTIAEATDVQHELIRRLTVSFSNQEEDHYSRLISTQRLSKVRSITFLGVDAPSLATLGDQLYSFFASPLPPWGLTLLLRSRFLRVLDLEGSQCLRDHHLIFFEGLVLLRYLGLAGTGISQLPEEIGKVAQLETLDLRRNYYLRTLPASIASLQKLARLLVDPWVHLPSEISKMQELEQVSTIGARSVSSLNSVAELLIKSKPLRMLDVTLYGHDGSTWRERVMSFLRVVGNSNLQSLSLCCGSRERDDYVLGILLDSWEVPPRHFRRFKLAFRTRGVVPPQMASLFNVTHLDIWISELEARGVRVLGDLPNLVLLKLTARISTRCVISGEKAFRCLKVFTFAGTGLEFTPGAMPQLQTLRLRFSPWGPLPWHGDYNFGIKHLTCLKRVHATIDCYKAEVSEVEAAEAAIRKQVSEFPIKPIIEFSRVHEDRMREDEGTMKTSLKKRRR